VKSLKRQSFTPLCRVWLDSATDMRRFVSRETKFLDKPLVEARSFTGEISTVLSTACGFPGNIPIGVE
jgi:hypothetical protein